MLAGSCRSDDDDLGVKPAGPPAQCSAESPLPSSVPTSVEGFKDSGSANQYVTEENELRSVKYLIFGTRGGRRKASEQRYASGTS